MRIEKAYLDSHADTNAIQGTVNVVCALHASEDSSPTTMGDCLCFFLINGFGFCERRHGSEMFLAARQMQELAVGGVKESDAEWDQETHYPEFDGTRECSTDGVNDATKSGVNVKKEDTS